VVPPGSSKVSKLAHKHLSSDHSLRSSKNNHPESPHGSHIDIQSPEYDEVFELVDETFEIALEKIVDSLPKGSQ
jgi:hypothetical protein